MKEIEIYEKDIENEKINDIEEERRLLSQLNNNEKIAILATQNRIKVYIQSR